MVATKKNVPVKKKKKILTLKKLSEKDWKIHVFNDNLQREISSYLVQKGLYSDTHHIKYQKDSLSVFGCTPEFVLALRRNSNYEKTKDYLLFHKRKAVNEKWTMWRG